MSKANQISSSDLQAKFNAAMSALLALGEQAGLSIPASGELSDSELEGVAGGVGSGGGYASSGSGSGVGRGTGKGSGSGSGYNPSRGS